uniref:Acyl-[acyl-carrier-protein] desaturase n=1 Tax=Dunaliella tertiolecta TaxID=3047 RepID=A0A7S3VQQ3_DUNTE|mmetsp:Transcript_396/g.999  ORF Transcript_396/g.999 Transcript_396/m.999 type:complete len:428 (+) Transcript_396:122-1405(+)
MKSLPWRKYRGASAIEAGKGTFKSTWSPSFACRSAQRRPQAGLRATTIPDAAAPYSPPSTPQPAPNSTGSATVYIPSQKTHSLHARGFEVINGLEDWAEQKLLRYLKPVQSSWQPQDLLPEPSSPDFYDQVQELRRGAQQLPNDYLVVLVGDMVTEEALPSYMSMLNTLDCTKDETGASTSPWSRWTRQWTAEENRHGDVLNKYLYLSGCVDMHSIESTIQRLIGSGLDPKLENNPYLCFVYTSFQERATKISHGNTARLAAYHGDTVLAKICSLVAADEARHEAAYTSIVEQLFIRDPEGAVLAFYDMMKKGIVMPAHLVDDGKHASNNSGASLFMDYATVADSTGVYTTADYADIVDHLVSRWQVADLRFSGGKAEEAQQYLCQHADRVRRLANIQAERRLRDRKRGKARTASFGWVNGRQVPLL